MNHSRPLGTILAVLCASLVSSTVQALANRVFVSARSGSDASACNNVLTPCQTFTGAVAQLSPGGEAIVLDSGGYGPVTITQALTIEAPPGVVAFVHPAVGDAITVNAGAADTVVLRGLTLNGGTGNGIVVNTAGSVHVEGCVISGFGLTGFAVNAQVNVYLKDTIIRNCTDGFDATSVSGYALASVERCRFEQNFTYGFVVSVQAKASIRNSVVSGNGNTGIFATTGTLIGLPEINVEGCLVANNNFGIVGSSPMGATEGMERSAFRT